MKLFVKLKYIADTLLLKLKGVKINGYAYNAGKITVQNGGGGVTLGDGLSLRKGSRIQVRDTGTLSIGSNTTFNTNCQIVCRGNIKIGSNVAFGQNVLILDHDHDYKHEMRELIAGEIEIGDGCWIGANVIILKGSKIGNHVVIGAGTVIKGEVPDDTVVYNKQNLVYRPYQKER